MCHINNCMPTYSSNKQSESNTAALKNLKCVEELLMKTQMQQRENSTNQGHFASLYVTANNIFIHNLSGNIVILFEVNPLLLLLQMYWSKLAILSNILVKTLYIRDSVSQKAVTSKDVTDTNDDKHIHLTAIT